MSFKVTSASRFSRTYSGTIEHGTYPTKEQADKRAQDITDQGYKSVAVTEIQDLDGL